MAESTEQEQLKQTQILQQTEKGQAAVSGKLDKVIAVLKEEGTQEALLTEMKEQDEVLLKAVKGLKGTQEDLHKVTEKIHKQGKEGQQTTTEAIVEQGEATTTATEEQTEKVVELSDKTVNTLSKGNNILEAFKVAQAETADTTSSYQDIMEGIEGRKADLAAGALADTKRSEKLAKREDGKVWGWMKSKGSAAVKTAGTFFENLAKLLALLAAFFILSWLKGKDLKKMWTAFTDKIQEIIDDWIPQWIQDLSFGEAVGVAVGALVAAFAAWKLAVWGAKEVLKKSWNGIKKAFGWRGTIASQLDDVTKSIAKLTKERNALKRLAELETDVGKKSKLLKQIDDMDVKLTELTDSENALKQTKKLNTHLDLDGDLAKQLKQVDDDLLKLAKDKDSLMKKTGALKGKLDANSPLAKQLDEVLDSMDELKSQRGVLEKTIEVNNKKIADMKAEAKASSTKVPKKGAVWNEATQRWHDPVTKKMTPGGRVARTTVPPVPVGAVDEIVKAPGMFKSLMNAVADSKLFKGGKVIGKGVGIVADKLLKIVAAPIEAIRGGISSFKASEGQDWDMRASATMKGVTANLADLLFTDTVRGAEAISGLIQDWWGDKELGTTKADYGAKDLKAFFEEKVGAFKEGTTLEAMLTSGEISMWDIFGLGEEGMQKVWGLEGKAWNLQMDDKRGRLKEMFDERAAMRAKQAKGGELSADEKLNLFLADVGNSAAAKFNKINAEIQENNARAQVRPARFGNQSAPTVIPIDNSQVQMVAKSNVRDLSAVTFIDRLRN